MADGRKLTMMIVADVRSVQIQRQQQVRVVDSMEHVVTVFFHPIAEGDF
tara:strand:- start:1923 stop:2069 length:147 start_codon:yes stop_codon:yes gene_type:complete